MAALTVDVDVALLIVYDPPDAIHDPAEIVVLHPVQPFSECTIQRYKHETLPGQLGISRPTEIRW
ncbi:hypothetical protein [Candidatus Palauibacter sp.]|uniref:hypothetical protein n=1 Tax=Candidatus Palauibacter sp. TaxID=3101350 RepID=UPI003B59E9C9